MKLKPPSNIFWAALASLFSAFTLQGQANMQISREQMTEEVMVKLQEDLELDSVEQDSIEVILLNFSEKMQEYKEAGDELKQALITSRDQKIKEILDEEEYAVYLKTLRTVQENHIRALRQKQLLDRERGNQQPMQYRRNQRRRTPY